MFVPQTYKQVLDMKVTQRKFALIFYVNISSEIFRPVEAHSHFLTGCYHHFHSRLCVTLTTASTTTVVLYFCVLTSHLNDIDDPAFDSQDHERLHRLSPFTQAV